MVPYLADVKAAETPLMKQYGQIKQQHPEAILLFRLGDFYETFGQDAELTAKACGITLTKRNNGAAGEIPLAGFPHHQLDTYLPRLVQAGHRVAVCEQLEDPKQAKGIVRRGVVEIVTPGVVLYDKLLHHQRNTYACAVIPPVASSAPWGVAFLDVSTGAFFTGSVVEHQLASTLEMHEPAEILVPRSSIERVRPFIHRHSQPPAVTRIEDWHVDLDAAMRTLTSHFGTVSVGGFGIQDDTAGIVAAGVLLDYVAQAQQRPLRHITSIHALRDRDSMVLDHSTRRTLELVSTTQRGEQSGALVDCLDRTRTPMGSRCLRWWVAAPLQSLEAINERLEHVAAFAGGAPSAFRAATMSALTYGLIAWGRRPAPLAVCGASALISMLATPGDALHPGFILSLLATSALLTLSQSGSGWMATLRESARTWLASSLTASAPVPETDW